LPNWLEVLNEVNRHRAEAALEIAKKTAESQGAFDTVRRAYLRKLFEHTGRNVITYYSGWLSKPGLGQSDINDEDKNGFMMAVHNLDRKKGLDLLLHTPGGDIAATESIVDYLHKMFGKDIRAIVPQLAMSAGTMIACSCRSIVLSKHSNLGPIDPHLNGIPAYGVTEEFRRAWKEIQKDPAKVSMWHPIISQYRPTFLSRCENAIKWSGDFVREQLRTVMFEGDVDAAAKAAAIVKKLTDYRGNKTHSRHIHHDECKAAGLKIETLEDDPTLQDYVLTVHHCNMHILMNTPAFKITENHLGTALIKNAAPQQAAQS
jgi:ClpP class serine protease